MAALMSDAWHVAHGVGVSLQEPAATISCALGDISGHKRRRMTTWIPLPWEEARESQLSDVSLLVSQKVPDCGDASFSCEVRTPRTMKDNIAEVVILSNEALRWLAFVFC